MAAAHMTKVLLQNSSHYGTLNHDRNTMHTFMYIVARPVHQHTQNKLLSYLEYIMTKCIFGQQAGKLYSSHSKNDIVLLTKTFVT